jgi:hypothetical protein
MHPVLDDLAFGNPLEEQPRSDTRGIDASERGPLLFGRHCALEVIPIGELLGRRRYDVAERLTPEESHALW